MPYLQWELYRYYGDADLMSKHYEKNKRWLNLITSTANNAIVNTGLGARPFCVRCTDLNFKVTLVRSCHPRLRSPELHSTSTTRC